jgi:deoxyguanosine kinase
LRQSVKYVAIEGPIGVGKTTLAKRLAGDLNAELILEGADANPFLSRFYAEPERYALATQLFFLLQRAEQLDGLRQIDLFSDVRIADFMLDKDRLFAELTLDAEEFTLYDQVYRHVVRDYPKPDLVIYMQAPVETLQARILHRGIDYEGDIDDAYLDKLVEIYSRYFQSFDAAPLLVIDAVQSDLVHRDEDYHDLLQQMNLIDSGRHFLTPSVW